MRALLPIPARLTPALLFGGALLLLGACQTSTPTPGVENAGVHAEAMRPEAVQAAAAPAAVGAAPAPGSGSAPAAAAGSSPANFGAAFEPGPVVALASLLSNPQAYAEQSVITEGRVQRACSRKGCWMEIGEGDDACRVTFKDYGFFVPTDSAGAQARVQGKVTTQRIEPARVAHLAAEGAKFRNRQADGSATEVQFIASAVTLARSGS
jgi:hypothetical protein